MFGGFKKDNGVVFNTDNIFAALESKKKKGSKKKDNVEAVKKSTEFWTKAPLTVTSWADCEDDDDDYYATAAPPIWSHNQPREKEESDKEESEDQEDYDIEEDVDEETDEKNDAELSQIVPSVGPPVLQVNKTREPEKQLSKKEIKKKELAELEKVLKELDLLTQEQNGSNVAQEKKIEEKAKGVFESKPSKPVLADRKITKKRKAKKEKPKEVEVGTNLIGNRQDQAVQNKAESNLVVADPKAVLKKLASHQKKKSGKESDVASKTAAAEAAARAAKQAAAKKKDRKHYNQHPPPK